VKTYYTSSPDETRELAGNISRTLNPGAVVVLTGELGAGKTTFVKGLAEGLGITGLVKSPTFTVLTIHRGPLTLYHIDLYRLEGGGDMDDIDIDSYLYCNDGISAVEWGEKIEGILTGPYLAVTFIYEDSEKRKVEVEWRNTK